MASQNFVTFRLRVWDNLIAECFELSSQNKATYLCRTISLMHLIRAVGTTQEDISGDVLHILARARVFVPARMYQQILSKVSQPDAPAGQHFQQGITVQEREQKVKKLNSAIAEIRTALRSKISDGKRKAAHDPAQEELPPPTFDVTKSYYIFSAQEALLFSEATREQLNELNIPADPLDAVEALKRLGDAAQEEGAYILPDREMKLINLGNNITAESNFCLEYIPDDPCRNGIKTGFQSGGSFVNSMFIGDLLVTKQYLVKYDLGEVAHIEAIMMTEYKERTHRRLNRTETTEVFEFESENETERETQTTERFSIEKETTQVVNTQMHIDTGVNVTGSFGPVNVNASFNYGYGTSTTTGENEATYYSKDVTNRALQRVKERIREVKTITILHEAEETAFHKFDNTDPQGDHVNGVYRWVDKYYMNKVINYGRRLLLEFTVPEPGNFYIFRKLLTAASGEKIKKPVHPSELRGPSGEYLTTYHQVTETNFSWYAAYYGVKDIPLPPPYTKTVNSSYTLTFTHPNDAATTDTSLKVPKGYFASEGFVQVHFYRTTGSWIHAFKTIVLMADKRADFDSNASTTSGGPTPSSAHLNFSIFPGSEETIPFSAKIMGAVDPAKTLSCIIHLIITCTRMDETLQQWKMDVYDALIAAYQEQKRAYDEWERAREVYSISTDGNNPAENRRTEREELKKRCIEMYTGQRFERFDAAVNGSYLGSKYPEILFQESILEGNTVKFLEQAFDWANMTYIFYPYFYGRKQNWIAIKGLESLSDPLFTKFLQAGYARVIVPVRPGFEDQVSVYHALMAWFTGSEPATVPGFETGQSLSLADEIREAEGLSEETGVVVGHYMQKVPTNLVYLAPLTPASPPSWPGLPDFSGEPNIVDPYML